MRIIFACITGKPESMQATLTDTDLQQIGKYVELGAEIPKETLIHRIAGKVNYSLFVYLKSTVFHHVIKDRFGKLYLV
jgi:hypothetical protein